MKRFMVSVLACCVAAAVFAADGSWQGGNGAWDDGAHWEGGVPAGDGGMATFIGAGASVSNGAVVRLSGMTADLATQSGPNILWTIRGGVFELDSPALFETRLVVDARDPGSRRLDLTETVLRSAADVTVTGAGRLLFGTTNELTGRIVVSNGNLYAVSDGGYGAVPASYRADAIILDGGSLGNGTGSPFLTLHPHRGITLREGGGYISVGSINSALVLGSPITGLGALNINMEASPAVLGNSGNDYTGGTFVGTRGIGNNASYDGALQLGQNNVIPDAGGLTVAPLSSYQTGERGSRLDLNGHTDAVDMFTSGPKATITSSVPGQGRLAVGGTGSNSVLRGTVSGGVTIAQTGAGTLTAIGANVRDATLDLTGGTLLAGGANLSADATVRFDGGSLTMDNPSGLYEFTGANASDIDIDAPLDFSGWKLWPEAGSSALTTYRQTVYRGRWHIPQDGTYSFGKAFDDGGYLRIGDSVIISNTVSSAINSVSGVFLSEGWHDIELRFANLGGGSGLQSNFVNGILYDPLNGNFADSAVRARGKMFTDDGGPDLRAVGAPNELRARLLLAQDATITVPADVEPFMLGGAVTVEPGADPDPVLTIANSGAPLLFGSSGAYPAVLDATINAPNGIVLTNRVWLRRLPQQPYSIADGADIALDGAALLGNSALTLTDWSVRVVRADSVGGDGSVTANAGTTVWFDSMCYADNRLTNSAAPQTYANAVSLGGGTAAFTGTGDIIYTGAINGTGAVRVEGPGTVRLTGTASAINGEIVLADGTLRPDSEATLGGASLRFAGGRLANPEGADLTLNGTSATGAPGGFEVDAGRVMTLNGAVTAAELSKWGAGTLTLGGAVSNTDLILHLLEGSAELAKTGSAIAVNDLDMYGTSARITGDSGNQIDGDLTLNGGATLDLNGFDEGMGGITGTGTITNGGGRAVTLTFGERNATGDLTNVTLAGGTAGYSLAKVGTGTFMAPFEHLGDALAARAEGGTLRVGASKLPSEGLAYRLDASDPANLTVAEGGLVTVWKDSSGKDVDLVNPSLTNNPQYVANIFNGWPAVYFPDGLRTRLYTDKTVACRTVFIVCRRTDNNNLAGLWGESNVDKGLRANSATTWRFTGTGGDGNDFAYNGEMYINGVATSTFAVGDLQVLTAVAPNNVNWKTAIGDYWNNDGAQGKTRFFNGYIGEILVYSTKLSDAARQAVEGYLIDKWQNGGLGKTLETPLAIAAGATVSFESQSLAIASLAGAGALAFGSGSEVWLQDYSGFTGTVSGAGSVFSLRAGDAWIRPQGLGTTIRNGIAADAVLRVDTTGNNTFIGGVHDGAGSLGITQTGSGVTSYAGTNSAYTGATRIEGGTAQIGAATAQYIRFWPTSTRTNGERPNSGYQLSEFRLSLGGADVAWPVGTRATCAEKGAGIEGPESAIDGLTSTKFYVNVQAPYSPLVIYCPEAVAFDSYSWHTANDSSGRDATGWHIDISEDGETWTTIDIRDYSGDQGLVTTARHALVGTWGVVTMMEIDIFSDVSLTTIAAPGMLALKGASETVGSLSGDGAVALEAGATFGINAFEDAAFAGGISGDGTVVKTGAATQTLSGALAFSGTLIVKAGTLDLTGATLTGVTNIIIMDGAELTGAAEVNGDLTVTFENGGAYSGSLAVSGALTVEGNVTLAIPSGAAFPYVGTLFTYASADATTQNALRNAVRPQTPSNMGAVIRVTDTDARISIAPTGTLLMLL